jgi:hypothetical protein
MKWLRRYLITWAYIKFGKKRSPPKVAEDPNGFDEYIIDDYIDSDHVC